MARASRLFDLLHLLHRQSGVVSGRHLAEQLGISLRTLYRDIATLQAMGADVLLGWCELRSDYRTFRIDRIVAARVLEGRYPRRRTVLLREWREANDLPLERFLLTETDAGIE
ncbi:MAG TPA: HTH domain-containing protein [Sphingomonas sanguinis]|uniref:helix-turn-helix domain-containing protein n=1 Tax=Sphingomonas sanguinis TaxID=33051 RepID=UPI002AC1C812|nr:HTH domain-containing protein [Sphingomonas sanguinis]